MISADALKKKTFWEFSPHTWQMARWAVATPEREKRYSLHFSMLTRHERVVKNANGERAEVAVLQILTSHAGSIACRPCRINSTAFIIGRSF